jgi:hypothetical protein
LKAEFNLRDWGQILICPLLLFTGSVPHKRSLTLYGCFLSLLGIYIPKILRYADEIETKVIPKVIWGILLNISAIENQGLLRHIDDTLQKDPDEFATR